MKTLRIAFLIAAIVFIGTTGTRIDALPGADVDTLYYDQNFGVIGEHEIICSGAHYIWGQQSGVFRSQLSESCDTGAYSKQCWWMSECCGWMEYSCDDPPPCGYDVSCGP